MIERVHLAQFLGDISLLWEVSIFSGVEGGPPSPHRIEEASHQASPAKLACIPNDTAFSQKRGTEDLQLSKRGHNFLDGIEADKASMRQSGS
jgi:hypothetical protein